MESRARQEQVICSLDNWKVNLIRVWYNKTGRALRNDDLTYFSGILDTPVEVIKAALKQIGAEDGTKRDSIAPQSVDFDLDSLVHSTISAGKGRALAFGFRNHSNWLEYPETSLDLIHADENVSMNSSSGQLYTSASALMPWNASGVSIPSQFGDTLSSPAGLEKNTSQHAILLKRIEEDIQARVYKGCGRDERFTNQRGDVPCTLGCGRLFRSACDRSRHEETVYPQKYWACTMCMDPDSPSRSDLFIRLDKIRDHNIKKHSGQLCINQCRVDMTWASYPRNCGICQHHFRSQHDRNNHISTHHSGRRKNHRSIHIHHDQSTGPLHTGDGKGFSGPLPNELDSGYTRSSAEIHGHSFNGEDFSSISTPKNVSAILFRPLASARVLGTSEPSLRLLAVQWSDEIQGEGAFGKVWKVEIAIDHQWDTVSKPRVFACKQMWAHEDIFEQEVTAFESLAAIRPRPAIVECYGTFDHVDDHGRSTRNLLLEHADGNLWQYWSKASPPKRSADIATFYSQLFNISAALSSIHHITDEDAGKLLMRHGDIKPENILHFPDSPGALAVWKLADFGLSKMSKLTNRKTSQSADVLAILDCCFGGTAGYTPPETDVSMTTIGSVPSLQRTDIWSFGCVLSLAATWTLKGFRGIQQFQNIRRVAAKRSQRGWSDCFHNGTEVLPEVRAWHNHLRNDISHGDMITGPLLDIIDQNLLLANRDLRPSASVLYDQLMRILQQAENDEAQFSTDRFLDDPAQQGHEAYEAPITDTTSPDFVTKLVESASKFWDSAIGLELSEQNVASSLVEEMACPIEQDI